MEKLIKLSISPFTPPIEEALGLSIQAHVPYGDDHITVLINGNLQDYTENDDKEGIKVRQSTFNVHNEHTKVVELNLTDKNESIVEGKKMKLMNCGKENLQGTDFRFYEILVSEVN